MFFRIQRAWRRYCNIKDKKHIVDSDEKDGVSEKSGMKVTHVEDSLSEKLLRDKFSRETTPDDRTRSSLSPCRHHLTK
jgi:hypothetical protein